MFTKSAESASHTPRGCVKKTPTLGQTLEFLMDSPNNRTGKPHMCALQSKHVLVFYLGRCQVVTPSVALTNTRERRK